MTFDFEPDRNVIFDGYLWFWFHSWHLDNQPTKSEFCS